MPGIGTIHGSRARSQASATWAGVAPIRPPIPRSTPTSAWFACRASGVKRGRTFRKSDASNAVLWSIAPVRKPLPSGA